MTTAAPSAPASTSVTDSWKTEGYLVARNLINPKRIPPLLEMSESILQHYAEKGHPALDGKKRDPLDRGFFHLNHPAFFQEHPEWFPLLMDLAADEAIMELLTPVLNDRPAFRCTSLFINPLVEHQLRDGNWHRDTQFTTKTDEEEKQMLFKTQETTSIQFQIALLPSSDSQVVPGSQLRWDTEEEYRIRKSENSRHCTSNDMPGAIRVSLEPGDAVAFDPCALHRGRYYHELPRRTLMLTYTATRTSSPPDFWNRQPWFLEPGYLDPLSPKTRAFFEPFIETYRESWLSAAAKEPKK